MKYQLLFFDLDGTLIDSREDLANSVNLALAEMGVRQLQLDTIFGFIGEGVFNLLSRSLQASLGGDPDERVTNDAVAVFRRHYDRNCLVKTRLYYGVAETLGRLDGYRKAVITNKPRDFSVKILGAFGIAGCFDFVAGGDSFAKRKPDPMPLIETARALGTAIGDAIMIGDSRIDIVAGKNAGIRTIGCTYGFRGRDELVAAGADLLIDDFYDLLDSGRLTSEVRNPNSEIENERT